MSSRDLIDEAKGMLTVSPFESAKRSIIESWTCDGSFREASNELFARIEELGTFEMQVASFTWISRYEGPSGDWQIELRYLKRMARRMRDECIEDIPS